MMVRMDTPAFPAAFRLYDLAIANGIADGYMGGALLRILQRNTVKMVCHRLNHLRNLRPRRRYCPTRCHPLGRLTFRRR